MEKQNPFTAFLDAQERSVAWLARQAGLSRKHVSQCANGRARMSKTAAIAMQAVTGGGITADAIEQHQGGWP
jgi:DNA-binding transcriptional regulator YdaS (Cro superfamily)